MKYQGNMDAASFLKCLNSVMDYKLGCCSTCRHINGECVNHAKEGTCNGYDVFHKQFSQKEARIGNIAV